MLWEPGRQISPLSGKQTAMEWCCLTGSTLRYHLLSNPVACAIGMDLLPERVIRRALGRELPSNRREDCLRRFQYVQQDIRELTLEKLDGMLMERVGMRACELDHIHAGWPCTTTSRASTQTPRQRGFTPHRWPDGQPRSQQAHTDDALLENIANLFLAVKRETPDMLLTLENPENDVLLKLRPVQRLLEGGWVLMRGSHCKAASSGFERLWPTRGAQPQKHTVYIGSGLDEPPPRLLACSNDCMQRLAAHLRHHRALVCRRKSMLPGQYTITDVAQKGRIPYFVWHQLWVSNCRRRDRVPRTLHITAPQTAGSTRTAGRTDRDRQQSARARMGEMLHARLNHAGESNLAATLRELGGVYEASVRTLGKTPCRSCAAGKMARNPSLGKLTRGRFYGDILHADIQEYEVPDIHGHRYSLMLVEDVTRGKWAYLLRLKSDAGAAIQRFCHQEFVPMTLRTDGAGEFSKSARPRVYLFDGECQVLQVCATYGINKQETIADDHDQMGVAEAANRRAAEGVRTFMYAANLPKQLWGDLIQSWCDVDWFVVNRVEGHSPFYIRYGRAPVREVGELRAVGSRVTYYGKRDDATKLDMRGHRAIYIGRDRQNGGYKICDVESVDPVIRTVSDINVRSFDEMIDYEPTGVDEKSIRLTSEKIASRDDWDYPPVRAVRDTVRVPGEAGKGSMWECARRFK